jgi:hypothetical protein
MGGQTLQERLAALGPDALAKTFAGVVNAISKDAATAVKSIYQNVTHDTDLQADWSPMRQPSQSSTRVHD